MSTALTQLHHHTTARAGAVARSMILLIHTMILFIYILVVARGRINRVRLPVLLAVSFTTGDINCSPVPIRALEFGLARRFRQLLLL